MRCLIILCLFFSSITLTAQSTDSIFHFPLNEELKDVRVTFDFPADFSPRHKTLLIFFALPNGNTTEQTMGKKMQDGDDWHFDIQHIRAQTKFLREKNSKQNIVVVYLENDYKSWPSWKQKHTNFTELIPKIVDTCFQFISSRSSSEVSIALNGHSGGGSFIFGYLASVEVIPGTIKRISFIDSNYGYDSSYYPKLKDWLRRGDSHLTVFAYNDSVALYNGKPVVSATGGTWHRSHIMIDDLSKDFHFVKNRTDSLEIWQTKNKQIGFFLKQNLNRGIYHTQQVELNGFIHSILFGTKEDSNEYSYYGPRAYSNLIK
jgi:hypothetical protein